MNNKFSPSTNILRDSVKDLSYIPTPNSIRISEELVNDFRKGLRAFTIIGSYGTGKSSFLVALDHSLKKKHNFFELNFLNNPIYNSIKLIGSYRSLIEAFKEHFKLKTKPDQIDDIFNALFDSYHDLGKKSPLLFIYLDEFGKFLEYAAKNNPERELYFVQQLAEFVNNNDLNIVLLTTIHQSFESYSYSLSNTQRQEWFKVKGRFKDIPFNEPVEQLLYLASEHIENSRKSVKSLQKIESSLEIALKSKAFTLDETFGKGIAKKIFPIELLSANVLTLALQRYGQNERSLFTFLQSSEYSDIIEENDGNTVYNLANVYDYLAYNFYSFITSKYNPDYFAWASIKSALEEVERSFDDNILIYSKIIKTIGLLNIFASNGSTLDNSFYNNYGKICLDINGINSKLEKLLEKKIIVFRKHKKRFVLFEGTDLDIQTALLEAGNHVSEITDITTLINKYYQPLPILAKQYSYENGTPRYFEFIVSDIPVLNKVPSGEIDGFVNLVFSESISIEDQIRISLENREAIIYAIYLNSREIKEQLFEIEKTIKVLEDVKNTDENDKIAIRELTNILESQKRLLDHHLSENLFRGKRNVKWLYKGEFFEIPSKKVFNRLLSDVCRKVYSDTPVFKNELINRHRISASIGSAKRNYYKALYNYWEKDDLGFETDKFPPEKTIFLTLLKHNGINPSIDRINNAFSLSPKSSFKKLWNHSIKFLESAKEEKTSIREFSESLKLRPFKLKQGLIDFWIPSFFFLKQDDFALFGPHGFIPYLSDDIMELIVKNPEDYTIKTFDIEGVKLDIFNSYRTFLNLETKEKANNQSFIETIKPFLTFYKQLPEYSKNTKRLSKEAIAIREAIVSSLDPEKTFFEDFPAALDTTLLTLKNDSELLHKYIVTLQKAIREIRLSYDNLIDRFEDFITSEIIYEKSEFKIYKASLETRFKKLKKHLLLPKQKIFIQRIDNGLDDRKAWLSSICQALLEKSLETIKDDDELVLYDRLKLMILDLDSLIKISKKDYDEKKENIFGIQLDSFVDGIKRSIIRLPKNKENEVDKISENLKASLSKDRSMNIAALAKLIKEQIEK